MKPNRKASVFYEFFFVKAKKYADCNVATCF